MSVKFFQVGINLNWYWRDSQALENIGPFETKEEAQCDYLIERLPPEVANLRKVCSILVAIVIQILPPELQFELEERIKAIE